MSSEGLLSPHYDIITCFVFLDINTYAALN